MVPSLRPPDRAPSAAHAADDVSDDVSDDAIDNVAMGFAAARSSLTAAQHRAVFSPATALCVLAGAGSGKTRVLTLRVARRILDGTAEADHTVVCTFTRKAAGELRQRLTSYGVSVFQPGGSGGSPVPGVRTGTLHQLALRLVRKHALDAGHHPPDVSNHRRGDLIALVGNGPHLSTLESEISWAKARGLTATTYGPAAIDAGRATSAGVERTSEALASYENLLGRRRQLDLDDLLLEATRLLHEDVSFAEQARWRYRHFSVDEFQDLTPAQFALVTALMGDRVDLCAVGDPNQAIYGWNGADPGLLGGLGDHLSDLEVVHLDVNHRCTPQVVATASRALGPTNTPPPRSSMATGPLPTLTSYADAQAEATAVADRLTARLADGLSWSDQAVLARTHHQLAVIRAALESTGIPCRFAPGNEDPAERAPASSARPTSPLATTGDAGSEGWVELSTFHRAKGLEWKVVYIVGLEEGTVPIAHATTGEAVAEERRLLYVAMTRAAVHLDCSWSRSRIMGSGRAVDRSASPWLADLGDTVVDGRPPPSSTDALSRFAALRANLGGREG